MIGDDTFHLGPYRIRRVEVSHAVIHVRMRKCKTEPLLRRRVTHAVRRVTTYRVSLGGRLINSFLTRTAAKRWCRGQA